MPITKSPDQFLRKLALSIKACPKYVRREAANKIKIDLTVKIDQQYARSLDPYGKRWPTPKDGHKPPMIRTGKLRRGYKLQIVQSGMGIGIRITNRQPYSIFLQRGTSRMNPRLHVPTSVIPETWKKTMKAAYQKAFDNWYKKTDKV